MGEKDIAEKTLVAFNDVFSDIVNVLLFNGKKVINENELKDATVQSVYKEDKKLREQIRDTAKYWENNNIHIALMGIENQTEQEDDLPLRIIGYDGASYRNQLFYKKDSSGRRVKNTNPRFPVVTIVLYFSTQPWKKSLSLYESLDIPEELKPFTNDYKVNLFEIAYLTDEQVAMFQSDFKIVADFFVQLRKYGKNATFTDDIMIHVDEITQLLSVLGHNDIAQKRQKVKKLKGEITSMHDLFTKVEEIAREEGLEQGLKQGLEQGREQGLEQGLEQGREQGLERGLEQGLEQGLERGRLNTFYFLVNNGSLPLNLATKFTNMSEEEFEKNMKEYFEKNPEIV